MENPTTRELKIELKGMTDKIEDNKNTILSELKEIKIQTTKTNGKVAELQEWKAVTKGALAILSMMVVPVLIYVVTRSIM